MEILVNTAAQEQRLIASLRAPSPYIGPPRVNSVYNVGDPVIVVDLTEPVDGDEDSPNLMECKGRVVGVENGQKFPVCVSFKEHNQYDAEGNEITIPNMWFSDAELGIDEAALLMADRAAQQAYEA